ncbi:uncharacterized [Tachysurus ichikawai]
MALDQYWWSLETEQECNAQEHKEIRKGSWSCCNIQSEAQRWEHHHSTAGPSGRGSVLVALFISSASIALFRVSALAALFRVSALAALFRVTALAALFRVSALAALFRVSALIAVFRGSVLIALFRGSVLIAFRASVLI